MTRVKKRVWLALWLSACWACRGGQHWVGVQPRVVEWTEAMPSDRVRLGVRDEGVYRVAAEEIARASGVSIAAVREALDQNRLSLSCRGRPISWTHDGDALYFYGVPTEEIFAPENVYWLAFGSGVQIVSQDASPEPGAATNAWFMQESHGRAAFLAPHESRDRRSSAGTLTNVLNFGEWVPASADEAVRHQSRTLQMAGYCGGAETGVTVRAGLVSYYDFTNPDEHRCEILVNGLSCGTREWSGEQAVAFEYAVPAAGVTNENLLLTVRNAGSVTPSSDFMISDVTLTYPRDYAAVDGLLFCTGGAQPVAAVGGFAHASIEVWDVTYGEAPVALTAALQPVGNGGWQAVFACDGSASRYAVFDASGTGFEPSVCGVRDTDWLDAQEMPELAIVVPPQRWWPGFAEAAQPLAAFRNAQGLRTRVVEAEALYNAFTDGLAHPEAFRRFSVAGVTGRGGPTLRYLLFAGLGGSDYKLEVFPPGGAGAFPTLFPLYLMPQVEATAPAALMLPNDPVLGDATGGAVPEVAVGRLLAIDAVELARLIDKTIRYELTETWKKKAIFSSDWQNVGAKYANFPGIAAATATGFSVVGWWDKPFYPAPDQSYLGAIWKNTYYQTGVYYELMEGSGFFYFVGHSSDTIAGNSGANKLFDAPMLRSATWPFAPVALLMGCRMGRWTLLDTMGGQQAVAEAGVRNPQSGFAAVISTAGYMTTPEAAKFSAAFRNRVAAGDRRLGDVWRGAFAELGDEFALALRHMVLLGDPALCIRADQTARGTSTDWLIEQGLSGDPYADLKDQDGDGFDTWIEAQAGTSPLAGGVRFREVVPPTAGSLDALAVLPGTDEPSLVLAFEVLAGLNYRVLSTTDLLAGEWGSVAWRQTGGSAWTNLAIKGDWPLVRVEVPFVTGTKQRFYKIATEHGGLKR